jgi:outer membrane lipoprotein SlyB
LSPDQEVFKMRTTTLRRVGLVGISSLALLAGGCNNAAQGGLVGAGLGALGGMAIGSLSGDMGKGAVVGAVAGGIGGAVIGDQNRRRDQRGRHNDY